MLNRRSAPSDHRRHDRLLVARFAAGNSQGNELDEARALLAACGECSALAGDLRLLPAALRSMPAPRRPRDFRLTAEQAQRLSGSRLERLMRGLTGPGWGALRPVAGVAMSLGLVLAVVGALPVGLPAAGSASDSANQQRDAQLPQPVTVATPEDLAPAQPGAEVDKAPGQDGLSNVYVEEFSANDPDDQRMAADAPPAPGRLLVYAGLLIAAIALGLLMLVTVARRRFGDPLLR